MSDKFDPYRESLVMERETIWPEDCDHLSLEEKVRLEELLHTDPENASNLVYVRVHTGFCRKITVTPEDLQRVEA